MATPKNPVILGTPKSGNRNDRTKIPVISPQFPSFSPELLNP